MRKNTTGVQMAALMALAFVLGACEYVAVAILPDIAGDLEVSLAAAGRLVSAFAAGYAVGTPVITAAGGRTSGFRLLMGLLAAFAAVNLVSALAPGMIVLTLSRMAAAMLTGSLTAAALLFAREAEPVRPARAIARIYTSMSLATVVGNPVCKVLCRHLGWRAVFAVIALLGALLLPVLARVLPRGAVPAAENSGFLRQFAVLRDRRYSLCVAMTVAVYAATYVVYTYLTPILTDVLGMGGHIDLLLMLTGICCMGSNLLAGRLGERGGLRRLPAVMLAQTALFALMPLLLPGRGSGLAAVFAMALLMYAASTPVQAFASELAEREYPFARSLCASTLSVAGNLGIAAGSFVSSGLQETLGLRLLGLPAALTALLALALNLAVLRACGRKQNPGSRLC